MFFYYTHSKIKPQFSCTDGTANSFDLIVRCCGLSIMIASSAEEDTLDMPFESSDKSNLCHSKSHSLHTSHSSIMIAFNF